VRRHTCLRALELLNQVRSEGLPHQAVVADAGYGLSVEFRRGLEERGDIYVVGVTGKEAVFSQPRTWGVRTDSHRGWPLERWYVVDRTPTLVPVKELAASLERTPLSWRQGTKGALHAGYVYGAALRRAPDAQIGSGLGQTVSRGETTLIAPTLDITHTGQELTIDGVRIQFQITPGTEAPAEVLQGPR